jgi:hypothetical protein
LENKAREILPNVKMQSTNPAAERRGMVGSDRYGFYVEFNTPQTNILAG